MPESLKTPELTWHQKNKMRRDYRLRNTPAHIIGDDWIPLCGESWHPVTVDSEHRNNPANKTCDKCRRLADKLKLPALPAPAKPSKEVCNA